MVSQISSSIPPALNDNGKKPAAPRSDSSSALASRIPAASRAAADDVAELAPPATPSIDAVALESAVRSIEDTARTMQRSLQFSIDEVSGKTVITVIDKATDEVIRQIPGEEILSLADHFTYGRGTIVKAKA